MLVVELSHPSAQSFRLAGVCRDRVNLGSGVSQAVNEMAEAICAASNQGHSIAALGEAMRHGHSKTRPGTNQQKMTLVDRGA